MNNATARRVWVTGASSGLGLALVERLLEQGARVAASGRASPALQELGQQYPANLQILDNNLIHPGEATKAARHIADHWGALDCLIINAGTCDYLAVDTPAQAMFEKIVRSNLRATGHCLSSALTLLKNGSSAQILGVLSRYSSLQLDNPSQPASADTSLAQLFNSQREALAAQAIDLTIIAPRNMNAPQTSLQVAPEQWTTASAAEVILERLPDRSANLVLEALYQNNLWPLPR